MLVQSRVVQGKYTTTIMNKQFYGLLVSLLVVGVVQLREIPRADVQKLIVDVDAGADDATALLTLLGMEAKNENTYKIEMITTVNGNTLLSNVINNTLKTLEIAGRLNDIPVYEGAHASIMGESIADNFFGNDGFGDFDYPNPPKPDQYLKPGAAANAMINYVNQYPGEVTILCLGPLTNLALAINLNSSFFANVKEVVIMGGGVKGVGNISPGVEFNARVDPEANQIVLTREPRPKITIVPWETALHLNVEMSWRMNTLGALNSVNVNFLNKAEAVALAKSGDTWISADSLAAVALVAPDSILELENDLVLAETGGEYARGAFFVRYTSHYDNTPNAYIVQKIDKTKYQNVLLKYLG